MGTDIEYFAEKRVGGRWELVCDDFEDGEFYFGGDRNYELFEILAGAVDERTGLTTRGFQPISTPRGLPADLSPQIQKEIDGDSPDCYFGHSWLLLRELVEFPWAEKLRRFVGYVNAANYELFKAGQAFSMCQVQPKVLYGCSDVKGYPRPEWEVVSNEEMERLIAKQLFDDPQDLQEALRSMELSKTSFLRRPQRKQDPAEKYWTQIEFTESYAVAGHGILHDAIPKLSRLGSPQEVRVVFWFG